MPNNKMSRAADGTGSIRKKIVVRKGKEYTYWEARYTAGINPGTGRQVQKSITGKTQSEVTKKLKAVLHSLDVGTYTEPNRITIGEWLDLWLEEYIVMSCKPYTISSYKSCIDIRIKPAIGKIKLSELSATKIQSFINDLTRKSNYSPKTVKNTHGILHRALAQAAKLRYIPFNPADACELPRMEQKEIHPLTEEEISAFLIEIEKGEPLARLFTVALFIGMREGEICGLPWEAVDFKNGTITIKQQLQKGKEAGSGYYITNTTKSDKSRIITAAPFVMNVLQEQFKEQEKFRHIADSAWRNEWGLVFTSPDGRFVSPQTALKHFKVIAAKIGRPDARFHDLRHTYAVTSLQEGDSVKTVQENLGHATASFTLDVYGHVSERMKKESAYRMEKFIKKIKE